MANDIPMNNFYSQTDRGKGGTKMQLICLTLGTYFLCYILIFDALNHCVLDLLYFDV